jgi:hypothetical protein
MRGYEVFTEHGGVDVVYDFSRHPDFRDVPGPECVAPQEPGLYCFYFDLREGRKMVYIGRAKRSIRTRLQRHASGQRGGNPLVAELAREYPFDLRVGWCVERHLPGLFRSAQNAEVAALADFKEDFGALPVGNRRQELTREGIAGFVDKVRGWLR